jgi:glycine cleavage system H protein
VIFLISLCVVISGQMYLAARGVARRWAHLRWPRTRRLAEDLCYYHPGHAWAQNAGRGLAVVGLDEVGSKVIGRIDAIRLPGLGEEVRQGEPAWGLTHKSRTVNMVSPVTGKVVEINEELERDPGLINRFPYTSGWVFKAEMRRVKEDLNNLFSGALAKRFMELSKSWISDAFFPSSVLYAITYQDGGELVEGIGDRLDDGEWEKLRKEIFLSD